MGCYVKRKNLCRWKLLLVVEFDEENYDEENDSSGCYDNNTRIIIMGLLTTPPSQPNIISKNKSISSSLHFQSSSSSSSSSIVFENSMSQEYNHHHHHHHHGHGRGGGGGGRGNNNNNNNNEEEEEEAIFAFPNGFVDRSTEDDPSTTTDDPSSVAGLNPVVYESAGMLSEMFNFGGSNPGVANPSVGGGIAGGPHEWYGDHQQHQQQQQHHHRMEGGGINAHNSAAAMQLFLTNAPPRSPSPPPPPPQQLLQPPPQPSIDAYHSIGNNNNPNFWGHHHNIVSNNNPGELGGIIEGQGLSLSLSSSLQHLEAAKHAEGNQIMFFNHHLHQQDSNSGVITTNAASSSSSTHFFKNLTSSSNVPGPGPQAHLGGYAGPSTSGIGYGPGPVSGSSMGVVNVLRNSKYAKPAQELLEEFCSVGRGQLNKPKLGRQNSATTTSGGGGGVAGSSSSVSKEPPQLSPADRIEHQRRKVKLLAMLDEVDRRYNHYCEQMQMVVNSFDLVMGYGGAIPYTALAQKAMSRHFRCLKDAVHAQLKHSCELLGEKDPTASSGLTKGETPRLKMLEQSLRQQRAFHQMGMMDQEAWRPQRGLPERSVNILRAWLFEHFLHPYPSDADKHLLARQTGLSRNQVSNWFINARVRLWKPMVEEMYQQEAKDRLDHHDHDHDHDLNPDDNDDEVKSENTTNNNNNNNNNNNSSFPTTQQQPPSAIAQNPIANDTVDPTPPDSDTSRQLQFNQQPQSLVRHAHVSGLPSSSVVAQQGFHPEEFPDDDDGVGPATMIRFGSAAAPGDVSLTLGLRHAGNAPDKNSAFSVRDFEGC